MLESQDQSQANMHIDSRKQTNHEHWFAFELQTLQSKRDFELASVTVAKTTNR